MVFVDGIRGTALKEDNVVKYSRSDMHSKALQMERCQLLIKFWGLLTTYENVSQKRYPKFSK